MNLSIEGKMSVTQTQLLQVLWDKIKEDGYIEPEVLIFIEDVKSQKEYQNSKFYTDWEEYPSYEKRGGAEFKVRCYITDNILVRIKEPYSSLGSACNYYQIFLSSPAFEITGHPRRPPGASSLEEAKAFAEDFLSQNGWSPFNEVF